MTRNVLVIVEHRDAMPSDTSFEVLGMGRRVADSLQGRLYAIAFGDETSALAPHLGIADALVAVEGTGSTAPSADAAARVLQQVIEEKEVGFTLIALTNANMGIGPSLAAAANLPLANFCLACRQDDGGLLLTCQLMGGKILADVRLPGGRGVICINPGSFPAEEGKREGTCPVQELAPSEARAVLKRIIEPDAGDIDITACDVLVSIGRGIQDEANIELAEELAEALGGAVSSSRPVVDQGWLPMTRQVGKSGMSVKPRLYLALGISGAPEHYEGMKNAKLIVAVNTDRNAPIFHVAQYGICTDVLDIVPALTEAVENHKTHSRA